MGTFIEITVSDEKYSGELRAKLVACCPVDIFALHDSRSRVRPEQEDECILCEACLELAPASTLVITKKYKDERLVSRASLSDSAGEAK